MTTYFRLLLCGIALVAGLWVLSPADAAPVLPGDTYKKVAEAECDVPHAAHKLFRGDTHPLVAALLADRVRLVVASDGLQTQCRQGRRFCAV